MAAPSKTQPVTIEGVRQALRRNFRQVRRLRVPWALFLIFGIPFLVIAILTPLTYAGIYVEPLRRFWQPWPPDVMKPLLAVAVFTATLAYLAFKSGRLKGFESGTVAATAAMRNVVENRPAVLPPPVIEYIPPPPPVVEATEDDPRTEGSQPPQGVPPPPAEPIAP